MKGGGGEERGEGVKVKRRGMRRVRARRERSEMRRGAEDQRERGKGEYTCMEKIIA